MEGKVSFFSFMLSKEIKLDIYNCIIQLLFLHLYSLCIFYFPFLKLFWQLYKSQVESVKSQHLRTFIIMKKCKFNSTNDILFVDYHAICSLSSQGKTESGVSHVKVG